MRTSPCRLVYTVEEVADLLGLSRSGAYELVRVGDIASVRLGRRLFVTSATIIAITGLAPPPPAELSQMRSARQPAQ